jgi:hypothetical protein
MWWRLDRFCQGGALAGARDRPTGEAEDRERVERLGGLAHAREKVEEEFCSVAPGPGREQKEGKWGPARALEVEKGVGGPVGQRRARGGHALLQTMERAR